MNKFKKIVAGQDLNEMWGLPVLQMSIGKLNQILYKYGPWQLDWLEIFVAGCKVFFLFVCFLDPLATYMLKPEECHSKVKMKLCVQVVLLKEC